jgi:hypothetical protein
LSLIEKDNRAISEEDQKLLETRKTAIFETLNEATKVRLNMLQRISKWISIIEEKLFSSENMKEMSVSSAINLFKYINNINMKIVNKIDKFEAILNLYAKNNMDQNGNSNTDEKQKMHDLKMEIYKSLNNNFKNQSIPIDAEIINNDEIDKDEIQIDDDLKKELDNIEDSLDNLDIEDLEESDD